MTKKKTNPVTAYLAEIGSKGGKKSRRNLTAEQARAMVAAREEKKASRRNQRGGRPKSNPERKPAK